MVGWYRLGGQDCAEEGRRMTKYKGDMIEPIPDTPEGMAWAITWAPRKREWPYLERFREPDEPDEPDEDAAE